jgi:protein arginine kinase activator
MLCQNCGRNEATTHIKRVINGATSENHLCAECAGSLGYGDMFSGLGFSFGELLGGFLGEASALPSAAQQETRRCKICGNSWQDIVREGKLGCAECYSLFFEELQPSLQRIHGRIKHNGKISAGGGVEAQEQKSREKEKAQKLAALKSDMKKAIEEQDFERAATLRDEIKALDG